MDRVSVYSGSQKSYSQTGLTAEKCYVFQVAAYVDGRWTRFTKPKYTSSLENDVEVEKLDEQNAELRNILEKQALAKVQGNACLLETVTNANVIYGDHASGGGSAVLALMTILFVAAINFFVKFISKGKYGL